jgi:hypothetical protein
VRNSPSVKLRTRSPSLVFLPVSELLLGVTEDELVPEPTISSTNEMLPFFLLGGRYVIDDKDSPLLLADDEGGAGSEGSGFLIFLHGTSKFSYPHGMARM